MICSTSHYSHILLRHQPRGHAISFVFADGKERIVKPLTKAELDKKMKLKDFEGQVYRDIFKLCDWFWIIRQLDITYTAPPGLHPHYVVQAFFVLFKPFSFYEKYEKRSPKYMWVGRSTYRAKTFARSWVFSSSGLDVTSFE